MASFGQRANTGEGEISEITGQSMADKKPHLQLVLSADMGTCISWVFLPCLFLPTPASLWRLFLFANGTIPTPNTTYFSHDIIMLFVYFDPEVEQDSLRKILHMVSKD